MHRNIIWTLLLAPAILLRVSLAASIQQFRFQGATTDQSSIISENGNENEKYGRTKDGTKQTNLSETLQHMLDALDTLQNTYFDIFAGTWPTAIDWTAAVMGTHISATLSSLVNGLDISRKTTACVELLDWDNVINRYFAQTSAFYFGENAFGLRNQAYDDMLWVVLGWLENIKFSQTYTSKRWSPDPYYDTTADWHGLQFTANAAHRSRIFYEIASQGWETSLCGGGMIWNPSLEPYKNAITNELFVAASIAMYLYFPGDDNPSPFMKPGDGDIISKPCNPKHLENAIKSYKWLKESRMQSEKGLYQDGFHITGWQRFRNGSTYPGTGRCDDLNEMIYTYNQGVLLSANRGLWLATGARSYLDDGHDLIENVISATGWLDLSGVWRGLGRMGVMEEFCDRGLHCSQDGQTFKGIFFHHLTEFCRPLASQEEDLATNLFPGIAYDELVYRHHLDRCRSYGQWIEHNAKAALRTKNENGLFGMWWGIPSRWSESSGEIIDMPQELPPGAEDHYNPQPKRLPNYDAQDWNDRGRGRTVETQSGGLAVIRALWQWESSLA